MLDAVGFDCPTVLAGADGAAIVMMFAATYSAQDTRTLFVGAVRTRILNLPTTRSGTRQTRPRSLLVRDTWGTGESSTPQCAEQGRRSGLHTVVCAVRAGGPCLRAGSSESLLMSPADRRPRPASGIRGPISSIVQRSGNQVVLPELSRYVADHIPNSRNDIEVDGSDNLWVAGDTDPLLAAMEALVTGSSQASAPERCTRDPSCSPTSSSSTEQAASLGDRRCLPPRCPRSCHSQKPATIRRPRDRRAPATDSSRRSMAQGAAI